MKIAALIAAFLLLCPNAAAGEKGGETAASPRQFSLVIRAGEITNGQHTLRVEQGDLVELVFASDEPARLHLHGYDIEFDVSPRDQTRITFEAHATGRFPLTSHGFGDASGHGHKALLYLEVHPD